MTEEHITCPVCDSEIPEESKTCPVCGVEVSLFDSELDVTEESDDKVEEIIDEDITDEDIMDEDIDEEELFNKIKDLGSKDEYDAEVVEEEDLLIFECPICDEYVSEDALKCPNCGAIFEDGDEEEEEVPEVEEEDISVVNELKMEYEDRLEKAKIKLAETRETRLNLTYLKKELRKIVSAGKEENYREGIQQARRFIESAETMLEIYRYIEFGKEKIKEMDKKGIDYKIHLLQLKKVKKMTEEGDFIEAGELMDSALIEMEKSLSEPEV